MGRKDEKEFAWYEGLAIGLSMVGVQLSSEVIAGWGNFFYTPPEGTGRMVYITAGMAIFVFAFGRIFDAFTDPLIGMWSDRTAATRKRTRLFFLQGRRRPFVFTGSLLMVFTGVAFWYPPVAGTSYANAVYATLLVSLHWGAFTLCTIPLKSLAPEIARSKQARVRLGMWFAVGMTSGLALSQIVPGILIDTLKPAGLSAEAATATAFQRMALIFAFVSLVLLQLPVWLVRERFEEVSSTPKRIRVFGQLKSAFANWPFLCYFLVFFFFQLGLLAVQRVLPHWAIAGLGGDEGTVSILMAPFILTALLTLVAMPCLARALSLKWMLFVCVAIYITPLPLVWFIPQWTPPETFAQWPGVTAFMGLLGTEDTTVAFRTGCGAALFGICGIGQGIFYAMLTPILGEIIDYDEIQTGERREALYSGLNGVAVKISQTFSIVVANAAMWQWGKSVEAPWGIYSVGLIAGALGVIALGFALLYPKLDVTRET